MTPRDISGKYEKKNFEQVSGLFYTSEDFHALMEALNQRGYSQDDLSVLMSEETHGKYFGPRENTKTPEGVTIGAISGGLAGALLGGITMVGNVILPGVGLLVAGPLVGALTAGAVGAATGGLIGGLIGIGIPEHEARFFEEALKEHGRILVVAHVPKEDVKEVKAVFERFNAHHLKTLG